MALCPRFPASVSMTSVAAARASTTSAVSVEFGVLVPVWLWGCVVLDRVVGASCGVSCVFCCGCVAVQAGGIAVCLRGSPVLVRRYVIWKVLLVASFR